MVAWLHACVPAGSVVETGGVDRGRRVTYAAGQWNGTGGSGYVPHQIHIFFRPRRARSGLFFPAPLWTRQEYDASPRRPHAASCNAWLIAAHNYVRNLGARLWASTCLVLFTGWINGMTHKAAAQNVMLC